MKIRGLNKKLANDIQSKSIDDLQYLVIGVEDGWIHVDKNVWQEYLLAKRILNEDSWTE